MGRPRLDPVLALLAAKPWFGFDLDDTLHEFRKASAHASRSVFEAIQATYPDTNETIDDLEATYRQILRSKTANAFTDGRTSEDYGRSGSLIFSRPTDMNLPQNSSNIYWWCTEPVFAQL
ncbi:hypothetical protein V1517DRAFT_359725 [Lipomyces orientalis]|uniref:Uncharacterized protein n=1 Tax=Lipomyces orientalis TaxID=1233043 RepID=A0ACC3TD72_9ASCO